MTDLLLDDNAFPRGWVRERDHPQRARSDPTVNNVYRRWWWESRGTGSAEQSINRAYNTEDAQELFVELRQSQFFAVFTPRPDEYFARFETPSEVGFRSKVADEFYLACGFRVSGHCRLLARYRNYVVELHIDRESDYEGHITHGLTYTEIEKVVRAMDAKFVKAMAEWYPETP